MNAGDLFRQFEKVADAPNAIAGLRRFILDLAVRGKLVSQNAGHAPASRLLQEIDAMRAELATSAKASIDRSQVHLSEAPFELPRSWVWTRLGRLTSYIQRGKSPKYADSEGSPVVSQKCVQWSGLDLSAARMVTTESLADYDEVRFLRDGDLLWNSTGTGTIGRVIRLIQPPIRLVCDSHVTVVRCLGVVPEYVRVWLRSDHVYGNIESRAAGSTNQVELTAQMVISQLVPLPPLAEQHRIVAKVDVLMALCDRLEAARAEREAARDRLTAASLARLNAPDSETFRDDARFALDALPAMSATNTQVAAIRQTILNLAVSGRLVRQQEADQPATLLLARITEERRRLIDAGGIPRPKPAKRDSSWLPARLPSSWEPAALGDLCSLVTSGSRGWGDYYADEGPNFVRAQNIRFGRLRLHDLARVNPPDKSEGSRTQVAQGDLLVVITGAGVTSPALLDRDLGEAYVSQHVALLRPVEAELSPWLLLCLMAPAGGRAELVKRAYGSGKPGLNLDNLRCLSVPIPPLAEQQRIVAKVSELMALCDQLETSLNTATEHRSRLLEALLHEVLDSGDRAGASAPADEAATA